MEKKWINPCELTWEEKHPKCWIYKPSKAIKKLKEILMENKNDRQKGRKED